MGIRRTVAR